MKKTGIIVALTVLFAATSLFPGAESVATDAQPDKMPGSNRKTKTDIVTITDPAGRKIDIRLPVERIAFNHFSTGEALKIIDAWDMVAGRSKNLDKNIFPDLDKIPVVSGQGLYDLDYEALFELDIDLFITIKIAQDGYDDMLSKLGPNIPVITMHLRDPGPFENNLETLGMLLGKSKETADYLTWYRGVKGHLENKVRSLKERDKPVIFYKTSWGDPGDIQTLTDKAPGILERNALTGSINVAGDIRSAGGWVQSVNAEWLATRTYDKLIVLDVVRNGYGLGISDSSPLDKHRKQVMALPAFSGSDAVRNNRVYMISGELFGTPRFIVGFSYMAKWFHPALFEDLNPKALHQEYLSRFLRVDCNLNEQGMFVYPAP